MKTKRYKIGEGLGHDVQIKAELVYMYGEREHEGKKYPPRRDVHTLADIRLSSGEYPFGENAEFLAAAQKVFDAMREAFAHYPDGDVSVSMIMNDVGVNW